MKQLYQKIAGLLLMTLMALSVQASVLLMYQGQYRTPDLIFSVEISEASYFMIQEDGKVKGDSSIRLKSFYQSKKNEIHDAHIIFNARAYNLPKQNEPELSIDIRKHQKIYPLTLVYSVKRGETLERKRFVLFLQKGKVNSRHHGVLKIGIEPDYGAQKR